MTQVEQLTYELAKFVADTNYEDLPNSIVEVLKKYTLDALGCGFMGSGLPWAKIVVDFVQDQGGHEESSVFGQPNKVTASQAALINGVMIGGFEAEVSGHMSHPGGTVPPAAFAIAERERVSGKQFLLSLALGNEVVCRIGDGQTQAVEVIRGFHNPPANGPFSSAAAVGKLYGFDAMTQARAFGIAGSYSGGLAEYGWKGEMTKRLHIGKASQGGLDAALLARKGFTGPITVLEGPYGYFHAFSPSPKLEVVLPGLGTEWRLETCIIRRYTVHGCCVALVDAIQKLKSERDIDPNSVTKLHIRAPRNNPELQDRHLNPAPDTMLGAQYSLPFNMAVAMYRDLDSPQQYDESVLSDEGICGLAQKVTWQEMDNDNEERLTLEEWARLPKEAQSTGHDEIAIIAGGTTYDLKTSPPVGSLKNPASYEDVANKFRRWSEHVLNKEQQGHIIDMVRHLDKLEDFSELAAMMRG